MRDAPSHSLRPSQSLRRTPTHAHSLHLFFILCIASLTLVASSSASSSSSSIVRYTTYTHTLIIAVLVVLTTLISDLPLPRRIAGYVLCYAAPSPHPSTPVLPWSSPHSSPAPHTQFPRSRTRTLAPAFFTAARSLVSRPGNTRTRRIVCPVRNPLYLLSAYPARASPSLCAFPLPPFTFHCFARSSVSVSLLLTHNYIVCSHPARLHHTTRRAAPRAQCALFPPCAPSARRV